MQEVYWYSFVEVCVKSAEVGINKIILKAIEMLQYFIFSFSFNLSMLSIKYIECHMQERKRTKKRMQKKEMKN